MQGTEQHKCLYMLFVICLTKLQASKWQWIMCCKSNEMTDSLLTDSISADTALQYLSAMLQHSISSWKKASAQQIIIVNKPLFDSAWQNCNVTVKMLIFFSHLVTLISNPLWIPQSKPFMSLSRMYTDLQSCRLKELWKWNSSTLYFTYKNCNMYFEP